MSALPITRPTDVVTLSVRVNETELPRTVPILAVEVVIQANRVPYARLRIGDGDAARGDFARSSGELFVPGNKLALQAGYHGDTRQIFSGIVLSQRIVVRDGSSWLEVDCRDPVFAMTLVRQNRYFTDSKDSAVASELLGKYGSQGVSSQVASTDVTHPQLLQYQATDWDFMIARLEAAGHICFAEAGKVTTVKPALDGAPVADIGFGATVLELDADIDARTQSGGIKAAAWDPSGQKLQEVTAADPGWSGNGNLKASKLSDAASRKEDVLWHGGSLGSEALQSWADGALLRSRLAGARGRVRFKGLTDVKPGTVLQLSRFSDRFNGKVYVTGVRHEFSSNNWTTDAEFGMTSDLHAQRVAIGHLPAAGIAAPVHGLQIGVVTEIVDEDGKEHRVRVKVPLAGMDEKKGVWARVAMLDAGSKRGTFFRPELEDEVVLGFFHDDPAQPVILGMLHSKKKEPPFKAEKSNDKKGYVSREGISLTFDDKKKEVKLETPGGRSLLLSDDDGMIVLADKNGNSITLSDKGIVLVSKEKDVKFEAKAEVEIKGKDVNVKAQSAFNAKDAAQTEIGGSATLTLKGGLVMIN
ncbi:MAG: type VI secretion system tip protein VgrG [Chromatiaceae bacterium]|nr:type VI secretion system tip protein VgrG [Chromatiaceae bacterium]